MNKIASRFYEVSFYVIDGANLAWRASQQNLLTSKISNTKMDYDVIQKNYSDLLQKKERPSKPFAAAAQLHYDYEACKRGCDQIPPLSTGCS